jgi:hypothetical protein
MAMFRRSRKPAPPLRRKQQEIAQEEAQLREKVESLQRIITQPRPVPASKSPAPTAERVPAGAPIERRFHVSIAMDTPLAFETGGIPRRSRTLRKERRHGRIVFLILLVALALAVMWLVSQLNP